MAAGSDCSKQNARRSKAHEAYYGSLPPKVAKRKDRNVRKSSRGKFATVADLVAHQRRVEGEKAVGGKKSARSAAA